MLGGYPGEDPHARDPFDELGIRERVEVGAGEHLTLVVGYPELLGDGEGGVPVVSRDHHRLDSGPAAALDGILHLEPRRVDHADEADEAELPFEGFRVDGTRRQRLVGGAEDAKGVAGHGVGLGEDGSRALRGQRNDLSVLEDARADAQEDVGRTLGQHEGFIPERVDRGHELPHRIEGLFGHAGMGRGEVGGRKPCRLRQLEQGDLGRVADSLAFARGTGGVVAEGEALDQEPSVGVLRVERSGWGGHSVDREALDRHPVLGEGSRLVRADDVDRSEGFDGGQLPHDRVPLDHLLHADGEDDGDDGGQPLRNGGDGEAHRLEEELQEVGHLGHPPDPEGCFCRLDGEHEAAEHEDDRAELPAEIGELFLERGLLPLVRPDQVGDLADFGLHAGPDRDADAPAVDGDRRHEARVPAVAEGNLLPFLDGRGVLLGGDRFPRQRRLVNLQVRRFYPP